MTRSAWKPAAVACLLLLALAVVSTGAVRAPAPPQEAVVRPCHRHRRLTEPACDIICELGGFAGHKFVAADAGGGGDGEDPTCCCCPFNTIC
ncbi:hypothetical protein ACP70R_027335 [Stipagrostis hirtigluma subsp. patula]